MEFEYVCDECGEYISEKEAIFTTDVDDNPITLCYECWLAYEYN